MIHTVSEPHSDSAACSTFTRLNVLKSIAASASRRQPILQIIIKMQADLTSHDQGAWPTAACAIIVRAIHLGDPHPLLVPCPPPSTALTPPDRTMGWASWIYP